MESLQRNPQLEKQIAALERKLTRFLMMNDGPDDRDVPAFATANASSTPAAGATAQGSDEEREERLNITPPASSTSSHSSSSNSKCHVLLRAPENVVERLLLSNAKEKEKEKERSAWLLKRGFDAKGLRGLSGEDGEGEGGPLPGHSRSERGSGEATGGGGGVLVFGAQEDREPSVQGHILEKTTNGSNQARRTLSASSTLSMASTVSSSTSSSSSSLGMGGLSLGSAASHVLHGGSASRLEEAEAEENCKTAAALASLPQSYNENGKTYITSSAPTSLTAEIERKPFSLLARNRLNSGNNSSNSNFAGGARRTQSSSSSPTQAPGSGMNGNGPPRRAQTDAGARTHTHSSARTTSNGASSGSGPVMGRMILDLRGKRGAGGAGVVSKEDGEDGGKEQVHDEKKLWCLFDTPVLTGKL